MINANEITPYIISVVDFSDDVKKEILSKLRDIDSLDNTYEQFKTHDSSILIGWNFSWIGNFILNFTNLFPKEEKDKTLLAIRDIDTQIIDDRFMKHLYQNIETMYDNLQTQINEIQNKADSKNTSTKQKNNYLSEKKKLIATRDKFVVMTDSLLTIKYSNDFEKFLYAILEKLPENKEVSVNDEISKNKCMIYRAKVAVLTGNAIRDDLNQVTYLNHQAEFIKKLCPLLMDDENKFSQDLYREIVNIIKEYIISHPKLLRDSLCKNHKWPSEIRPIIIGGQNLIICDGKPDNRLCDLALKLDKFILETKEEKVTNILKPLLNEIQSIIINIIHSGLNTEYWEHGIYKALLKAQRQFKIKDHEVLNWLKSEINKIKITYMNINLEEQGNLKKYLSGESLPAASDSKPPSNSFFFWNRSPSIPIDEERKKLNDIN